MKDLVSTLLFLRRGDEILLAMKKRGFGTGRWNGVGGKLNAGETLEQAVVRECQEEIGVTPMVFNKVAVHDFILNPVREAPWHMHVQTYICTHWEGEPTESEEMAPQWFKTKDIPYDQMWQDDRYWLPQALGGKLLKTKFTFDTEDNVLAQEVHEIEAF